MEEKELSEKSTKEEVAEFFITKLNIKDDYANIFINEYISGDILPLMTEEEFKNVGFKLGPSKKIHRYIQANISKFKQIKINEKITFDSTNEEVKKFFKNHLNFNIESNDLSGKKLLILKEEDMQELGMKFGQRKRLINVQKQFLLNFLENIKSFSEFDQMIFQEKDFFQKGKNYKILCFQTLMNFIKIEGGSIINNIGQSSFVQRAFELQSKIYYDLKNNNIKFNKVSNLIDEDETFYEKILLVIDNENEAKTIYSKLKDDIKICKEKIVNIENILYYYSTFYPISKEEIIKIIKIKLSELQEKEIDKLKNIEINTIFHELFFNDNLFQNE